MPFDFKQRYFRLLPAVDKILQDQRLTKMSEGIPHALVVEAVQDVIAEKRSFIQNAASEKELGLLDISPSALAAAALDKVMANNEPNLQPVFNATGVILHTNLGRAPLAAAAVEALKDVGSFFSNLELSLKTGRRSSRYEHVEEILCRLTGAEGALVVNNNAAAVFLALNTLACGKEVIVSRGELVEIGGSFRLPEVMASSGAFLVEVGSTNRTYLSDYSKAVNDNTGMLLKVHTSNFKVMGFTATVKSGSLVELGRKHNIPVMDDLGSGVLIDLSRYGLPYEPRVQDPIAAGVDLVAFSGDKLLGGPQAGILVGKNKYLDKIKSNQLTRALRVDKFTLAALEATLRLYLDEKRALKEIPVLRMLTISEFGLQSRAETMAAKLKKEFGNLFSVGVSREKARVGGGSLPQVSLPSYQVTLESAKIDAGELAEKLRQARPPVIARVKKDKVLLDLRSIRHEEEELFIDTIIRSLEKVRDENFGGKAQE